MQTHYDNLQVSRKASPEVIKAAYRALAQKLHPDKNPSEFAAQQFRYVTEAYEKLSNPEFRANYDEFLAGQSRPGSTENSETIAMFLIDAWIKGRLAAEQREPSSSNPYDPGSNMHGLWLSAYESCPKILKVFNKAKHLASVWLIQIVIWGVTIPLIIVLKIWLTRLFH